MTRRHSPAKKAALLIAAMIACALATTPPLRAATPVAAGSAIANTAKMSFTMSGASAEVASNTVVLTIDEILDVTVDPLVPTMHIAATDSLVPVAFTVTNRGNASETFALTAATNRPIATIVGFATDSDGNGAYDPAVDARLSASSVTIDAGAQVRVFVLVSGAQNAAQDIEVSLGATGTTGHGDAGTTFPGAGTGGVDAVVGKSGATATGRTILHPGDTSPRLEKSQSVLAPDGSVRVMPGSVITYRLDAVFPGATGGAEVRDMVPAGTVYVPGSLTLDGKPLTDGVDDDAASFDGNAVRVGLGDIAGPATHVIRFQTRIL